MIKSLICLLWGHETFAVICTVNHAPASASVSELNVEGRDLGLAWVKLLQGSTTTSLRCPRCCKIVTIEQ